MLLLVLVMVGIAGVKILLDPSLESIPISPAQVYFDVNTEGQPLPNLVVQPHRIGDRSGGLRDIRWQDWGERIATAYAIADINICKPSCAEANYVTGLARLTAFDLHNEKGKWIYGCLVGVADQREPLTPKSRTFVTPRDLMPTKIKVPTAMLGPVRPGESRPDRTCPDAPPSTE